MIMVGIIFGHNYKNEYGWSYFFIATIRMIVLTKEGDIERVFIFPQVKREI